jgi:hypothetical protein
MTWGEAFRLTRILTSDPGSAVAASINEWEYALSREAIVTSDLYDLQHTSKSKRKPTPYPRPWNRPERRAFGTPTTREHLRAVIDAQHTDEVT